MHAHTVTDPTAMHYAQPPLRVEYPACSVIARLSSRRIHLGLLRFVGGLDVLSQYSIKPQIDGDLPYGLRRSLVNRHGFTLSVPRTTQLFASLKWTSKQPVSLLTLVHSSSNAKMV